jgi:predicted transcriptional regulator of viral defense system
VSRSKRAFPSGEMTQLVYEAMKKLGKASLGEIWDATGLNPNTIRNSVRLLTVAGLIEREGKGVYKIRSQRATERSVCADTEF